MPDLAARIPFFVACDRLKTITRANWTYHLARPETVAEHVWHATLLALLLDDGTAEELDHHHVRNLLVVHDLVEIYAGDTVLWDDVPAADIAARESAAGEHLMRLLPLAEAPFFDGLWREFQLQETAESRYARAIDALHPMVMSWYPGACGHANCRLTPRMMLDRKAPMLQRYPRLWALARWLIRQAVNQQLIPDDADSVIADVPETCPLADRLRFVVAADALKQQLRPTRLLTEDRPETVAEHNWHVTLLGLLLRDVEARGVDTNRVRDLLTVHELARPEARVSTGLLPEPQRSMIATLIDEYVAQSTPEARFARAMDTLHPVLQTWLPESFPNAAVQPSARAVLNAARRGIDPSSPVWPGLEQIVRVAVERGLLADDTAS